MTKTAAFVWAAWATLVTHAAFSAEPTKVGARVPFITLEAEQAKTNGALIRMEGPPAADLATPEIEASGRSYVRLEGPGKYCEFKAPRPGNALTIRYVIPDSPAGGGITTTLGLYRNGRFVQKLPLNSRYSWLYGDVRGPDAGQSNDPRSGKPRVFWNDSQFLVDDGAWRTGDTIRLQLDDSAAEYVGIDLVDLERAPPALRPPRRTPFVSITDFGATGDDSTDDSSAIEACLAAAKAQGAIVWLPPGTYHHSSLIRVDGLQFQGAGMWHTSLVGTSPEFGFVLSGAGSRVANLAIESSFHQSRKDPGGRAFRSRFVDHWSVENVCVRHVSVGFWLSGASRGSIRGCRVYCTYADAININRSSHHNVIEHNYVRGAGDDGIATLAERKDAEPSAFNTIRRNTVIANWWGHNVDVAGGYGHVVEANYLADNSHSACLALNLPSAYPMHALTGAVVRDNVIVRGGGNFARQRRGAIWTLAGTTSITGVRIENNHFVDSLFHDLHLHGSAQQEITFAGNQSDSPGVSVVRVDKEVSGQLTIRDNMFRNLSKAGQVISNNAAAAVKIIEKDNTIERIVRQYRND